MATKSKSGTAGAGTTAQKTDDKKTEISFFVKPRPATTPPASGNSAQAADTRLRNFLSPQKALAIAIAGLVAILRQEDVTKLLKPEQVEQVDAAHEMADKLNSQTIKPVQDEIIKVRTALTDLTANPDELIKSENIAKVREYATTLARLQKRLETFTGAATATI